MCKMGSLFLILICQIFCPICLSMCHNTERTLYELHASSLSGTRKTTKPNRVNLQDSQIERQLPNPSPLASFLKFALALTHGLGKRFRGRFACKNGMISAREMNAKKESPNRCLLRCTYIIFQHVMYLIFQHRTRELNAMQSRKMAGTE